MKLGLPGRALSDGKLDRIFIGLFVVHFIVRLFLCISLELGVDEAYYVLYGMYPSWSYFDHPPMVGWMIWLTTAGLYFTDEFFVRLGPLLLNSAALLVVYRTGIVLRDRRTGLIAACLTVSSIYCSILCGVFVLPDTPLFFCWTAAVYCFVCYVKTDKAMYLWLYGMLAGLALMSKYQGAFLVVSALLYLLYTDYRKLWSWRILPICFVPLLLFMPVLLWNMQAEMVSLRYHSGRVDDDGLAINLEFFLIELAGSFFYNSLWVIFILFATFYAVWKKKVSVLKDRAATYLLTVSLPLILIVLVFSLFNRTLPHWSGIGYYGLILLASYWLPVHKGWRWTRSRLKWALALTASICVLGVVQIHTGVLPITAEHRDPERMGSYDFTLDMYGWEQLSEQFDQLEASKVFGGGVADSLVAVVAGKWFPGGHLDYYIGTTKGRPFFVEGHENDLHHYMFANTLRGGVDRYRYAYYVWTSRYPSKPSESLLAKYQTHGELITFTIRRRGKPVYQVFVQPMVRK